MESFCTLADFQITFPFFSPELAEIILVRLQTQIITALQMWFVLGLVCVCVCVCVCVPAPFPASHSVLEVSLQCICHAQVSGCVISQGPYISIVSCLL